MKKETKTLVITWVAVLALIACVIGATYAYFTAQMGSGSNANINANTGTTDSLKFTAGSTLSITANQENFAEGKGNRSASTTATAELIANNTTNSATYNYYLYLDIAKNEFVYTTDENTAELILQITKPDGTALTTLNGLNYVTVGRVSGFDITTKNGLITLADNYEIKAEAAAPTATKSDEWTATLILVNLDSDQKENTNKQFVASLKIQKEKILPKLVSVIINTYGTDTNLYLHNESLENGANDGSYRYSGADPKNYVCFGSIEETCPENNLYRIIGVFGDQVKLIKEKNATTEEIGSDAYTGSNNYFYWSGSSGNQSNTWSNSTLNTSSLNGTYLTNLGTIWTNKIATTTWYVYGITSQIGRETNAQKVYSLELGKFKGSTIHEAKVGMPYLSEYMYAASPIYWTYRGDNWDYSATDGCYGCTTDYRASKDNNWMINGTRMWTLTRVTSGSATNVFRIDTDGYVYLGYVDSESGVRPSFYLNTDVKLAEGLGTKENPYRIEI